MAKMNKVALTLLWISPIVYSLLCDTLVRRSIAKGQPFQLPTYEDEFEPLDRIAERLTQSPWNMTVRIREGWFIVKKHHWDHVDLLRAFQCSTPPC